MFCGRCAPHRCVRGARQCRAGGQLPGAGRADPERETELADRFAKLSGEALDANTKRFIVIRGAPKSPKISSSDLAGFDALPSGEIFGLLTGTSPRVAHFDPITEAPSCLTASRWLSIARMHAA